jgi:iron complex outermembrane receptor protein
MFSNQTSCKQLIILLFIFMLTPVASAQKKNKVRLLDSDTHLPIADATFKYGDQSGLSNTSGTITFVFKEGESMVLSHLNYGEWKLDENQLLNMIKDQVYYRQSKSVNLYPVTVIAIHGQKNPSEKMLLGYQDRMAHDGAAVLSQSAAFNNIRKSGNFNFDPVFRGFKYDQLNIVMNGAQSATAACPNRMDPPSSQMAPNMMDRIEILKGPHAFRFGSGFGATINFIPEKLRFTDNKDFYGRISSGYESNGEVFQNEAQTGISGKNYDVALYGAWAQGNDYSAGNQQIMQSDFERGSFGSNMGFKLTPNQQIRLSAKYNRARNADFAALPMDLIKDNTLMMSARHDIQISKEKNLDSWNSNVFASFVDHLMSNELKPLDPRMMNAETTAKTYNYGVRTEGVWKFGNSNLFGGADLRVEGASGMRTREFLMGPNDGNVAHDNVWQDGQITKAGIFAEYQMTNGSINYVVSGRINLNHSQFTDPDNEFAQLYGQKDHTQINPGFSMGVSRAFLHGISAGLWLGRAQRSGSLTERFINYFPVGQDPYEMIGNPGIRPEINNQADLTLSYNRQSTAIHVDLFAAYMQDYISSFIHDDLSPRMPNSPGVRQFTNIDHAFKTGFEVNWVQNITSELVYRLGFAYTYAQDMERNEPLPEIAPADLRQSVSGNFFNGKLAPEISFRYVTRQERINESFGETTTPSFNLFDLKMSYQVTSSVKVIGGANNLFDQNYYEHLNRSVKTTGNPVYARGRQFYASVSVDF